MDAIPAAWLSRKVFQSCEVGLPELVLTWRLSMERPRFPASATRRGFVVHPTEGFRGSYDGSRLGVRDSILGRFPPRRDFQCKCFDETSNANRLESRGGARGVPFAA